MSGTRGPLPKPPALRLLEGNAGKRALDLSAGVNPRIEVPSMPKWLGQFAKKEWRRITPILEELGLISGLDLAALGLYCQSYGRLVELETAFESAVKLKVDAGTEYCEAVELMMLSTTPSGYQQQSVRVTNINSQRLQVHRQLAHFGLSPAQRGRVQPSNYVQSSLPGFEPVPRVANGFAQFASLQ